MKDEGDLVGRIGVYATSSKHFLPHVLTKERLSNCVVVLMLSLCEPWSIDDQIFYWSSSLEQHMKDLKLEDKELATLQHSIADRFASYILPESEGDQILLPVPEGALTTNIGLPLIVLLSKVDNITNLQKNYDYDEEHFDYIQWYLRKFCLEWGAGLLYTSPRENSNCQLFMDYICHVLYEMKFSEFAQVIDKDSIFVPIGWDSPAKMSVISEGFNKFNAEGPFVEQIKKQVDTRQKRNLKGEDDQLFLTRMQAVLAEKAKSPSAQHKNTTEAGSPTKGTKTPPPGEGVLANFFNSLLQKKSPVSSPSPPPTGQMLPIPQKPKIAKTNSNPKSPGAVSPRAVSPNPLKPVSPAPIEESAPVAEPATTNSAEEPSKRAPTKSTSSEESAPAKRVATKSSEGGPAKTKLAKTASGSKMPAPGAGIKKPGIQAPGAKRAVGAKKSLPTPKK